MRLLSQEVYDLEVEHTKLNLDKFYVKTAEQDPCFIELIDAAEDALAAKVRYSTDKTDKTAVAYVKLEDACKVLQNAILSIRHILIRQKQITKLSRPDKEGKVGFWKRIFSQ